VPTAEDVIAHIFTTENPETGSQPPAHIAWVVFAHGTSFFSGPTEALPVNATLPAIAEAGKAALRELGPVRAGSSAGDFRTLRLEGWYPDEPVWFVGFDHPDIATVVTMDAESLAVGLEGRRRRQRDHDELAIVCVRGFDGAIARPEGAQ